MACQSAKKDENVLRYEKDQDGNYRVIADDCFEYALLTSPWFQKLNDKHDLQTAIIVSGYYRSLLKLSLYPPYYETSWIILAATIQFYGFNMFALGITESRAQQIWLSCHNANDNSIALFKSVYNYLTSLASSISGIEDWGFPKYHFNQYRRQNDLTYKITENISSVEFQSVYEWFIGACLIMRDLKCYYAKGISKFPETFRGSKSYWKAHVFYIGGCPKQWKPYCFRFRIGYKPNYLDIEYFGRSAKQQKLHLKRLDGGSYVNRDSYKVYESLDDLIRSYKYLQWFYCDVKRDLFIHKSEMFKFSTNVYPFN